jgi:hypothetical protein
LLVLLARIAAPQAADLKIGLSADVTTMDPHFVAAQPNLTAQFEVSPSTTRSPPGP